MLTQILLEAVLRDREREIANDLRRRLAATEAAEARRATGAAVWSPWWRRLFSGYGPRAARGTGTSGVAAGVSSGRAGR